VLPIPGASRVESLESSVAALEVELTGAEVERLDRAFG
jgi:aryl-alcohol dehydrogenase-like predicted oxidoreductase